MNSNALVKAISDNKLRENIIDSHSYGISKRNEFIKVLDYFFDKKAKLFDCDLFYGSMYDGDDEVLDLVLPTIRSLWGKVFINPPQILRGEQLSLFQLSFDLDHFIDYLLDMLPKVKKSLDHFSNLDRSVETVTLIVDNYLAFMLKNIKSENITSQIRDIKIRGLMND